MTATGGEQKAFLDLPAPGFSRSPAATSTAVDAANTTALCACRSTFWPGVGPITIGDGLDFISELIDIASLVEITGQPRGCVDPDDDAVIETAEVGAADYLITGDSHLLKGSRIRANLDRIGTEVITARDFLARFSLASPAPSALDQARMIMVVAAEVLRLAPQSPKLVHSSGDVTLALRGVSASASVGQLSASLTVSGSLAVKVIKADGTEIDADLDVGHSSAPPGD